METDIRGFLPQSLLDYPDNIAAVVFTAGCNMSCPFCYNKGLVKTPEKYDRIPEEKVLFELERRKNFLDGVVISGGEPTLQMPALFDFVKKIKEIGMLVKLDTNGLNPEALETLLPVVDYVAMDVKAAQKRYKDATGVDIEMENIKKSIELLKNSGKTHEFRTTVVPEFVPEEDFEALVELVDGAERYFLQQYRPIKESGPLSKVYQPETLNELAELARQKVKQVSIRGV